MVAENDLKKLHSSEAWVQIREAFYRTGDAAQVQSGLTKTIDAMSTEAFGLTLGKAFKQGVAMLAVGGYGRKELFPYSDIDIMILLDNEALAVSIKESLSEFVRLLWDAGLRLSHSVHTVADCVEVHDQNAELNVSLLDRRLLAGDASVYGRLENRMPLFVTKQGHRLARHLCQLTRTRHQKYEDTLFHLEPDIKETPGGLRDLHFLHWIAGLRPELRADHQLGAATAFLSSLRCFLHYDGGRDRNVLNFEAQERITEQSFTAEKNPALWMREYFNHARAVSREALRTLDAAERSDTNLFATIRDMRTRQSNPDCTVSRDRLMLRNPAQIAKDPEMVMRVVEFVARHGVVPSADTERRLEGARPAFAEWCAQPRPLWRQLKGILQLPYAVKALRLLQDTGLLQALLPEWGKVVSLVVRDFYHRYTVDEHTLVCLERLAELRGIKDHSKDPGRARFAELFSEIDNPSVLLFALLFHDVGKGAFSGKHSKIGAEWVRIAMERMQAPAAEIEDVAFLVLHHLALSEVMTGRDLADPATAQALAERVGTIERLKMLAVLTYADISGVNPTAMTPWRLEQLWSVYRIGQQELTRELETERIREVPKDIHGQGLHGQPDFLKGLPVRYLRTHSATEVETHLALYEQSRPTGVAVRVDKMGGAYQATIIARDAPALFASLAGALSSFGLDILKAEAFSNTKGIILDTFVFADPRRTLELNPSEVDRLRELLAKVATGKTDVQKLLRNRPAAAPKRAANPPRVRFDSDACQTATLVEIAADDRPGLLYGLATVFSAAACNIDVVLIDTKGNRAIDVFYVAQGAAKLTADIQETLKERLLSAC